MQANDSNTPLHLLQPDYEIPYGIPTKEGITDKLVKVLKYLEKATPAWLVDEVSNESADERYRVERKQQPRDYARQQ